MLKREELLDAMSGIREEDILAAARAMGYLPGAAGHRRSFLRPLLIAAVLAALLTATAVAAGLLGRARRLAPMPPDRSGEARQAEIVNGFRGSPTYQGSAQWWEFMARWQDEHGPEPENYRLDFVHGDLDRYLVCTLYRAYAPEQAERLYEIAEEYGLKLCREQVYFSSLEEFYALTGVEPFLREEQAAFWGGYVLEDGAFALDGSLKQGRSSISFRLCRYYTGSIVPFGGAGRLKDYTETEYMTARQEQVFIDLFGPGDMEITYMDPAGETYISLQPFVGYGEDALTACREIADQVSFRALCRSDTRLVQEILDQPTGAEENPEAVAAIRRFQESPAFRAGKEFQDFYEENFYGVSFSGTYGLEGYPDIDEMLEKLSRKYGLTYAREKTRGLGPFKKASVFDNGAWQAGLGWGYDGIHYIPRDALYTMNSNFLEVEAFRRIWPYVTEEGTELIICTQGPTGKGGGYIFLETEDAYILMGLNGGSPGAIEEKAEAFDWDLILKTGG